MELKNNTILITGGTSGFGFEFASRLLELGNTVIITGRNVQKLEETKKKLPGIHIIQSDVSDPEAISDLFDRVMHQFPDLNILINNAGEMRKLDLRGSNDLNDLTREIRINLVGPIHMVQQFLGHLTRQKSSAILNVTSGIALMPFPVSPIYSASKAGLRSYTQTLREQVKKTGVKVFELVAPGSSTPLNDQFRQDEGFDERMLMAPGKIVEEAIQGLQKDRLEIYPGLAKVMRIMSRVAPKLMLSQASRMSEKILAGNT